ncbi:uncharacterized protein LOC117108876 [Anneissia japonica]|uniref:uncharacterized protein LOC117108876 n=1 Tax=Anneissia japonica TaxID=1529436 RepID=UPI00142564F5|nr:uncharacterized protein LOC117108876 [Anneissia japonica]
MFVHGKLVLAHGNEPYRRPTYTVEKGCSEVSVFLNRILGLEVELQNQLFQHFMDTLDAIIDNVKRDGKWDMGILDLGFKNRKVKKIDTQSFQCRSSTGTVVVELHKIVSDRGISWEEAYDIFSQPNSNCSFYQSKRRVNDRCLAILTKEASAGHFLVYRPSTGCASKVQTVQDINLRYTKVPPKLAKSDWETQYDHSEIHCTHSYRTGKCKLTTSTSQCKHGVRKTPYHILTGSVLSVWSKVEQVLRRHPGSQSKMQIIRVKLEDDSKLVGCLMPDICVDELQCMLTEEQKASIPIVIDDDSSSSSEESDESSMDMPKRLPLLNPHIPNQSFLNQRQVIPDSNAIPTDSLSDLLARPSTSQVMQSQNDFPLITPQKYQNQYPSTTPQQNHVKPIKQENSLATLDFLRKFDFDSQKHGNNLQQSTSQMGLQDIFDMPILEAQPYPEQSKNIFPSVSQSQDTYQEPLDLHVPSASIYNNPDKRTSSNPFYAQPMDNHTLPSNYLQNTNGVGYNSENPWSVFQSRQQEQYIPFQNESSNRWSNGGSVPQLETEPISPSSESSDSPMDFKGVVEDAITRYS